MLRDFTKEKFDILIQAGQSNSEGYGFGPATKPYTPSDKVLYLNPDFTISRACELVVGNEIQSNFGLPFAREYMEAGLLAEDRKILILRSAVGGTGFADNRWGMTDDLYLIMMDMIRAALSLNSENRLVGLLWHQGETEACANVSYETHYKNLSTLVNSVKSTFQVPDLPFMAGDFVHHWKNENADACAPIVDAMRAVCRDCSPAGFVETDGLLSNDQALSYYPLGWKDRIHFTRESIYELGVRYFNCYKGLIGK